MDQLAIEHRQLKRIDRRAHIAEALAPWHQPQAVALLAVLERLQADPIEGAHQIIYAPAIVSHAPDG